ncbi:MAG: hypothetical protein R3349_10145 [Geminicoccaceae bacterium]|nr:hypothetical protein [Geminicoccaceae bacterium]
MAEVGVAFRGGRNIALKTPAHQYQASVAFYRDVLRLRPLASHDQSEAFEFGPLVLWIDRMERLSQAEVWLEVVADDLAAAAAELDAAGVDRVDAIEPLPEGFQGFWIVNPAGLVHLLAHPSAGPDLGSD